MAEIVARAVASPTNPPWRQCHASTVLVVGGELLCAWFAGTAEGESDNQIWLARGVPRDDGWRFGGAEVMSDSTDAHWNPVLGRAPDGSVALFYKKGSPISSWQTWIRRSVDGREFAPPTELVPGDRGGRGPVKNPPLVLDDGTWVAPASVESADSPPVWDSFMDLSSDGGLTWQRSALVPIDHEQFDGAGAIQPTVWVGRDSLVALLRTTAGRVWRSASHDGGRTWTAAEPTTLPNNNSGLCAVALSGGAVVCAHNTSDVSWGPRNELALSISTDDGLSWDQVLLIDELPDPGEGIHGKDGGVQTTGRGELSYPTVIADPERSDQILVSYTKERRSIVVATVRL